MMVCEYGIVLFREEPLAVSDNIYLHNFHIGQDKIVSGDGFGVPSYGDCLDGTLDGGGRLFVPNEYKDHHYTDKNLEWSQGLGEYTGDGKGRGF